MTSNHRDDVIGAAPGRVPRPRRHPQRRHRLCASLGGLSLAARRQGGDPPAPRQRRLCVRRHQSIRCRARHVRRSRRDGAARKDARRPARQRRRHRRHPLLPASSRRQRRRLSTGVRMPQAGARNDPRPHRALARRCGRKRDGRRQGDRRPGRARRRHCSPKSCRAGNSKALSTGSCAGQRNRRERG